MNLRIQKLLKNIKSLLMMFCLFSTITSAQYVAGLAANSLSLRADCASMAVDALSYLGNMVTECRALRGAVSRRLELTTSALSLLLLAGFTLYFMSKAAAHVSRPRAEGKVWADSE